MKRKKEPEKPLRWFILPNESYKWDFILEQYDDDNAQKETNTNQRGVSRTNRRLV